MRTYFVEDDLQEPNRLRTTTSLGKIEHENLISEIYQTGQKTNRNV